MTTTIEQAARVLLRTNFFPADDLDEAIAAHERENTDLWRSALHRAQALSDAGLLAGGWRPISEAPRDEDWCILLFDASGEPVVHAAFRSEGDWWTTEAASKPLAVFVDGKPTHWMPLPSPPEEGRNE